MSAILRSVLNSIKIVFYIIVSRKWKKNKLYEFQFRSMQSIIENAWQNIPFYKEYWKQHNFSPDKFKTLEDISLIPMINKEIVRTHYEDMVSTKSAKNSLTLVTTGGTTGMPMKFYINNYEARTKEIAFQIYYFYKFYKYKYFIDKVVVIRGFQVDEKLLKKNIYWQRSMRDNGLIFSSFHISSETYKTYLDKIRSYKPKVIKAYPSSILALCTLMKKNGDYGIDGLQAIICSSENLYESHKTLITEVLNVRVISYYGHSEKSVCAFETDDGNMYFPHLYGYTEFIMNEKSDSFESKNIAEVVVTSFNNKHFPFIRYQTGDIVQVCDKQKNVATKIIGRSQEFVYNKNGDKAIFTCHDELLWGISGIVAYQYIQDEIGKILLLIQVDESFRMHDLNRISRLAYSYFINIEIEIKIVSEIKKTISGKFRYLIQNILD